MKQQLKPVLATFEGECLGKRTPSNNIVAVDLSSVDEKRVSIQVSQAFDEDELTVCCEVTFLRDSGYGSMAKKTKEKCSSFSLVRGDTLRFTES